MWIKIESLRNGTLCRVSISRRFEGSDAFICRAKLFLKHSDSKVFFVSLHLQRDIKGKTRTENILFRNENEIRLSYFPVYKSMLY